MNSSNPMSRISSIYIHALIVAVPFFALFSHTLYDLFKDWGINDNYSHGYLIPFITAYMVWQKKDELEELPLKPSNIGIAVILGGVLMHIVGDIGAELFTMRVSVIVTLGGLILFLFGWQISWKVAVPVAYLSFMVPIPEIIWNKLAFPLQLFAAKLTAEVVNAIGIPILREGNILILANTTLEVVDACSGIRSLTSLLALSGAYAYIMPMCTVSKLMLFLSAIPIAVVVNIFRLTTTAVMARYIGPEAAHGFLHDISGVLVFIVAFMILFLIHRILTALEASEDEQ
jgi:exosortase